MQVVRIAVIEPFPKKSESESNQNRENYREHSVDSPSEV